ncbi:MAG: prepilin-type N-terminal cleavage/methylation domain-containing protein [Phycisphaerales bacterium]|nr:prepilin-type N-terminal cleavage/methylation domain-containing protein [Phycisphaerales bacterium]
MNYPATPSGDSRNRGFSVVEMMVTIGVLVLVAAGVSAIFTSIGDTVARGRKVSELNRFASQVERVMREDFERMTRDGFLVIVNQNATDFNGNLVDVQLSSADASDLDANGNTGRVRRVDEIMFFARGSFASSRRALASGLVAESSEAAIYYGHGQKRPPALGDGGDIDNYISNKYLFFNPQPYDNNYPARYNANLDASLGASPLGELNPNRYAKDWSLLRHVTLLMSPESAGRVLPQEVFGLDRRDPNEREYLEDSERQIALQPVARSIFSSLRGTDPRRIMQDPNPPRAISDPYTTNLSELSGYRRRASGLVDIAVGDLGFVRSVVTSVNRTPRSFGINPRNIFGAGTRQYDNFAKQYFNPANTTTDPTVTTSDRSIVRQWMIDALPSEWDQSGGIPVQVSRVRYEDVPTRLLYSDAQFNNNDTGRLQQAIAESNQEMLGSSVFLPRCTEFIVEWSYGFVNENIVNVTDPEFKQLIWYGRDRRIDSNADGLLTAADRVAARFYNKSYGRTGTNQGPDELLVVGHGAGGIADNVPEIACFGYFDPNGALDPNGFKPWSWPRFIRVTMSIADASDPTIEETYQVVLEVPAGGG